MPLFAIVILIFVDFSRLSNTKRFMLLSSTTKTCASGAIKLSLYAFSPLIKVSTRFSKSPMGAGSLIFCGSVTVNVEPSP